MMDRRCPKDLRMGPDISCWLEEGHEGDCHIVTTEEAAAFVRSKLNRWQRVQVAAVILLVHFRLVSGEAAGDWLVKRVKL